jgi:hypothetical protein
LLLERPRSRGIYALCVPMLAPVSSCSQRFDGDPWIMAGDVMGRVGSPSRTIVRFIRNTVRTPACIHLAQ